ncbi:hypothetical protein ON010_g14542 [Phytophthora cinnamomi]|nr:hypothetical protein ON010_g14542 [Phytophthora cinnamomi]
MNSSVHSACVCRPRHPLLIWANSRSYSKLRPAPARRSRPLAQNEFNGLSLHLLHDLHDVFVLELVLLADLLRLVLAGRTPDPGVLEFLEQRLVDTLAEILDRGRLLVQNDGRVVIGQLAARLGVNADHVAVVPDHLEQLVEVPAVVRRDNDVMRDLVDDGQLLDRELVDLVEHVEARDVDAVALDLVDELVHGHVGAQRHVGVVDLVLVQDLVDRVGVQLALRDRGLEVDAAALLAAEDHVGRLLVEADAEALELELDELLVRGGLHGVQHDEDDVARARRADDLSAAAFAVLGALDDAGQVEDLDARAAVVERAGDGRERRELVGRRLGEGARELREQRGLAHGREAHEPHARVAGLVHVEALACAAAARLGAGVRHLAPQLGDLGLEQAQVLHGGLVLLRARVLGLQLGDLGHRGRHGGCARSRTRRLEWGKWRNASHERVAATEPKTVASEPKLRYRRSIATGENNGVLLVQGAALDCVGASAGAAAAAAERRPDARRRRRQQPADQRAGAVGRREARTAGKTKISMVVIGHVDAGKSTITGHLLYKLGYVSKRLMHKYEKESREAGKSSFAYAWVMDADDEERARGVTMDVGTSHFETATKHVTLLDAPGHRDFIPKMIAGAAQADVAVLVVPSATGEFEAAFENSGQTKEHTLLVRSLGVSQMVVAVNKMDMVDWDKERFDNIVKSLSTFLQGAGFRPKNLRFVPLSGMTGANLEKTGGVKECSWYSGPSLVEAIGMYTARAKDTILLYVQASNLSMTRVDTFAPPQRQISKPFRMTVSDVSKSMSLGQTISGRVYAGAAAVGDSHCFAALIGMEQDGKACTLARAGDTIEMGVTGIDPSALTTGSILCSIASPVQLAKKFEAKIMTMPAVEVPLVKGTYVTIHMHNVDEPVNITRLVSILSKTGEVEKKKPRCITRERSAVVQITCHRKICLEEFANYRQLGRFTLRDRGKTLAAGIITQIIA